MTKESIEKLSHVERVVNETQQFKLVSREFKEENTVVDVEGVRVGEERVVVVAGPCAVENRNQTLGTARAVKRAGAVMLRGGAFKPRTSCYSFQGLGEAGLKILQEAKKETGLPIVTEVMTTENVGIVARRADVLQIGCRNMQNFDLLTAVGKAGKPVLLKRGFNATVKELLLSAEYIMAEGNENVILCERGIRTFETETRNTLDLSAVPVLKKLSHLPVIVDPSHATGKKELIVPMCMAAIAAGADGLIVEVHTEPEKALCDGPQALLPEEFERMMHSARKVAEAVGRAL
ncbi:MAG: 3-deoxy-7-phosphoheptulonate synthase [archaeon]